MRFKAATLKVSLVNFKCTLGNFITNYICVVVLLVEGVLQKEWSIALFAECLKQLLREDLLDKY